MMLQYDIHSLPPWTVDRITLAARRCRRASGAGSVANHSTLKAMTEFLKNVGT